MCLKEQKRIGELVEILIGTVVPQSEQKEYTNAMPVYDVRDYSLEGKPAGIYTLGGFVGELVIALNSLQEFLMVKGDQAGFEIRSDQVMKFLEELLLEGYPQGICFITLSKDLLTDVERNEEPAEKQAIIAATRIMDGRNITGYGLKFLLETCKAIGVAENIVQAVIEAICKINYHQPAVLIEAKEDDTDE